MDNLLSTIKKDVQKCLETFRRDGLENAREFYNIKLIPGIKILEEKHNKIFIQNYEYFCELSELFSENNTSKKYARNPDDSIAIICEFIKGA